MQVLNPVLYERLTELYGDVEIVAAGQEIVWSVRQALVHGTNEEEFRLRRDVQRSGEEYKVRCQKCRDQRARLHINHRWGVWDPGTETRNLWMANCYNESCYSEYEDQHELYERIYEEIVYGTGRKVEILPGRVGEALVLREVPLPGPCVRLDALEQRMPKHPALEYLRSRQFDIGKLSRLYDVSYCFDSTHRWASDRIIIPFRQAGMLVGWQARYIGDSVDGVPFNKAKVPKFYTCPGMPKRLVAYNIERALLHPTVICVEGATDTWNVGPMAMGCLGKTLSSELREMVALGMRQHGDHGLFVIALDPKQDPKDVLKDKPHHCDKLLDQLWEPLCRRVLRFRWPSGTEELDPGSMDRDWFRELVRKQAAEFEFKVNFSKPRV